ncbi:Threonine/homoserine/homoserine lactone efflux protein [Kushneria avicenniae]|uniref:Threonine/homoserine/homoserine lactone efflux protein n=1 Tax=Kushneria avicenniae TaxID=402385 RepID=A0A1I1K3G9_9GAMM|nr:LysE family translocator [Kushneria avicenniae]SFC53278.1 Threonine/homoserine/homoserine lactone efflux protein [Kushneria avicenniae]
MSPALLLSMAAFALAASLTPGPVNLVALNAGLNHGFRSSLRHVTGASLGFTLLLVLIGLGLQSLFETLPLAGVVLRWVGVAFLLYMAAMLALSKDREANAVPSAAPSFWQGALMQWLNPEAWVASAAAVSAYTREVIHLAVLAVIFLILCQASVSIWAAMGHWLGARLTRAHHLRRLNQAMAALLVASALAMALMSPGDTAGASPPSLF